MHISPGIGLTAILFSIGFSVAVTNTVLTGDPTDSFLNHEKLDFKADGITDVDVKFADNTIYLNVHTGRSLTCQQVIDTLGISDLTIKTRTLSPICIKIDDKLIRISYIDTVAI